MKATLFFSDFKSKFPPAFLLLFFLFWGGIFTLRAQDYQSFFTGDTTDVSPQNYVSGIVLAGGATDNDDAMRWMLERADGGDVLVLRASGSDGYNDYFYEELGVEVNSVETILFYNAEASTDEYVLQQIANAEVLFIAGGDQYNYYQYWKDTPVEDAINALINEKQITVGGTSAGMAILSNCYYTPSGGSLDADEALSNPFHPDFEILGKDDFLDVPFTTNTITDTHFDQRERAGRTLAFLARLNAEYQERFYAIASNEYCAVCIDENGIAHAYGEFEDYPEDRVYFLASNCLDEYNAELLEANMPLTWSRLGAAVKAYNVPATSEGTNIFDLNDWSMGVGGTYENWYVEDGELFQIPNTTDDCAETLFTNTKETEQSTFISPNPFLNSIAIEADFMFNKLLIINSLGQIVFEENLSTPTSNTLLETTTFPTGSYYLILQNEIKTAAYFLTK